MITDNLSTTMITPSEVIQYIYCPRYIYFEHCLGIGRNEDQFYKVQIGREIHKKKKNQNKEYLRKKLGVVKKENEVYLASIELGIRGEVDQVLFLNDGTMAPLDYKFSNFEGYVHRQIKIQSIIYAMLIKDCYNSNVKRGYLCYIKEKNYIEEIIYSDKDIEEVKELIKQIFYILLKCYFPKKARAQTKCYDCCYRNICV